MAPFMGDSWEGKSSWAGVGSTKPGRVFYLVVGDDFTSIGGKVRDRVFLVDTATQHAVRWALPCWLLAITATSAIALPFFCLYLR
jgi:hypothetical protein